MGARSTAEADDGGPGGSWGRGGAGWCTAHARDAFALASRTPVKPMIDLYTQGLIFSEQPLTGFAEKRMRLRLCCIAWHSMAHRVSPDGTPVGPAVHAHAVTRSGARACMPRVCNQRGLILSWRRELMSGSETNHR